MYIDHPAPGAEPALAALWQQVFGDTPEYIAGYFRTAYAPDRCLGVWDGAKPAAMLHWLDMTRGTQRLAYLYAVATGPEYRGRGLCRSLMARAHALLARRGYAGTVLVPQEAGLRAMYAKMGYREFGGIREFSALAGEAPEKAEALTPEEYNRRRAALLPPGGVALEEPALRYLCTMASLWGTKNCLLAASREDGVLFGWELLGDVSRAPGLLAALDCGCGSFRTPGEEPFAMFRSLDGSAAPGYLGFAFD